MPRWIQHLTVLSSAGGGLALAAALRAPRKLGGAPAREGEGEAKRNRPCRPMQNLPLHLLEFLCFKLSLVGFKRNSSLLEICSFFLAPSPNGSPHGMVGGFPFKIKLKASMDVVAGLPLGINSKEGVLSKMAELPKKKPHGMQNVCLFYRELTGYSERSYDKGPLLKDP